MAAVKRRFVVLDRDGTLIESHHYLSDPDLVRLLPRAAEGVHRFRAMDLGVVVVTNQSPIGRGLFGFDRLDAIHARLEALLSAEGVGLDGLYVCPHRPDEGCECRKPGLGLVERAASEHGFEPRRSFVIGDNACDIDMGNACGASTFLVRSGYGEQVMREASASPDHVVDDLVEAAGIIRGILGGVGVRKP